MNLLDIARRRLANTVNSHRNDMNNKKKGRVMKQMNQYFS